MGAIWKYNAGVHFAKYHPTAIPTEHLNNITISKSERTADINRDALARK